MQASNLTDQLLEHEATIKEQQDRQEYYFIAELFMETSSFS